MARRAQAKQSLRGKALQWLAQREHSRQELESKLLAWCHQEHLKSQRAGLERTPGQAADRLALADFDADAVRQQVVATLDKLTHAGLLSDSRYVASVVRQRAAKVGLTRLERELGRQGTKLSSKETKALMESEYSRAFAVWARRYGPEPAADATLRLKQMRFLAARGFDSDVIRRVVRGHGADD